MKGYDRCYTEISRQAILHNIRETKKRLAPGVKLLGVIKADAYGHGAVTIGHALQNEVDYFAVATLEEAVELREHDITLPILILGYTSPQEFEPLIAYNVMPTIYSFQDAEELSKEAGRQRRTGKLHIALDTGMTRIGFQVNESEADEIARIAALPNIEIEGMFTHFSCADQQDKTYCMGQLEKYECMVSMLEERGVAIPIKHVCNSAGIMEFTGHRFDMVRSGIITYGIYPSEDVQKENLVLQPALQWKCHVIHVKNVEPGLGVSYGATYVTSKPVTRIATVSVGYADGYPRALSSKGRILIRGQYAPIIGRVCMDQMMADVTDIPGVEVEDVVTLVGKDGENFIPIEEVADPAGRFNYEMLCNITKRVTRKYID